MLRENTIEKIVLGLISLSFFIGLWHGFPFTNVVADEMFSGAVLRAMQSHSILPISGDVAYGTITYYLSYITIGIWLGIAWVFSGFDIVAVKFFIIQNPFIVYGLSRLVSFALAVFCLLGINFVLKKYVADYRNRLIIISLLFTNILVNILFHTSKVWILSTTLMLVSFYFLVKIFEEKDEIGIKKYICYSIISAFLAFANFPLMGITLVSIIILFYKYRSKVDYRNTIIKATLFGFLIFLLVVASNFSAIKSQVFSIIFDYSLSPWAKVHNASLGFSTYLHFKRIIIMFPLLILLSVYAFFRGKLKHHSLFFLSSFYLLVYVVILIVVDRWSIADKAFLRYSFPVPFFMAFIIASFDFSFRRILLIPVVISVIYLVPTLYLLSVPTTSHKAVNFIRTNFSSDSNAVFVNMIVDTAMPRNKLSFELFEKEKCASLCKATIEYNLDKNFKPLVLDANTDPNKIDEAIKEKTLYFVLRAASSSPYLLKVASFTAPVEDTDYYSADNSGNYFAPVYFNLDRFGPNIYIYKDNSKI